MRRWLRYKYLRILVGLRKRSVKILKSIESEEIAEMDQIQRLVYTICIKLIHDPNSELISSVDYTYHIENEEYLIIIRPKFNHYSVTLIEFKSREYVNSFDVMFEVNHVKILIENFEREINKRMKGNQLLKSSRVSKHLQQVLDKIENKIKDDKVI